MTPLRAIFFDIDGTLYSTRDFAERARRAAIDAMVQAGVEMPADELYQELAEVIREFTSNYENHFDKLLLRIPRRVYRGRNPALIVASGVVAYHQTKFRHLEPFEDAYEALRRLAHVDDLIRGVITEGLAIKQAEKLVRLRLDPFLSPHAIFISHQIGISKPNPKLYQRACGDLNLKPSQCMYVGDNPLLDIEPADSIGMITVRIRRGGPFVDQESASPARHDIQNFWDLLEILRTQYGLCLPEAL
ncbi:MAG: HAD-IA family hydrolase [Planctomycetes bacterium]|nr:HAD-IA family hydrolase [Planctomycetota bacterium]